METLYKSVQLESANGVYSHHTHQQIGRTCCDTVAVQEFNYLRQGPIAR